MAGEKPESGVDLSPPESETTDISAGKYPPANLPLLYADGFANAAPQGGVMKIYLFRNDAELTGLAQTKPQLFAQLVLPLQGFVQAALFFNWALDHLIRENQIDKALVDTVRAQFEASQKPRQGP